jgi:hypothetical protein
MTKKQYTYVPASHGYGVIEHVSKSKARHIISERKKLAKRNKRG